MSWSSFCLSPRTSRGQSISAFAMKLLGFVALYGFILAPMGAIIVFEEFFAEKWGIDKNYAENHGISFNWAVFIAWISSCGIFYVISVAGGVFLSFLTLPAWIASGFIYLLLSKRIQRRGT